MDIDAAIWHYVAVPSLFLTIFIAIAALCLCHNVAAATGHEQRLTEQRQIFQQAWKAARRSQFSRVRQFTPQLQDYPLLPYLQHRELDKFSVERLPQAARFIQQYPMFPDTERLRDRWIVALAQRRMWPQLLELAANNATTGSVPSRCLVLTARLRLKQMDNFEQQAIPLFLSGKSQPKQCDPVFSWLYRNSDSELVWQRVLLAFNENQVGLVRHLGRYLDARQYKLLRQWLQMHSNPATRLRQLAAEDTAEIRAMAMHGIKRLAQTRGIDKAINEFNRIKSVYSFTPQETDPVISHIGIQAVRKKNPRMIEIMDMVKVADAETFSWQIVAALRNGAWQELLRWTSAAVEDDEINKLQRSYWHARALMETGKLEQAGHIFKELATRRDYYGFAAADIVNAPYQVEARAIPNDAVELARVAAIPVVQRAREWLLLNEKIYLSREWRQLRKHADSQTLEYAAVHSSKWGWHYGSILALGAAQSFDIIELRFPVLYREQLTQAASDHGLDQGWIFGLVRSESVFVEDIRSPAGALGLMQVMPATGAMVARKIGLRPFNKNMLLTAKYNVTIGSSYLREMYDMFNGNLIYATAAYNAGPHRVVVWDRRMPCVAADVWVETIPFSETKKYVKKVLLASSIYDWLLQKPVTSFRERIGSYWQSNADRCSVQRTTRKR